MIACLTLAVCLVRLPGAQTIERPFLGVILIKRSETSPRSLSMNIVQIDLRTPGIRFRLTPPGGSREAVRQTTLAFLNQQRAQVAINSHYFLPFPSTEPDVTLIGLAASDGNVYSAFEAPAQAYAILRNAPAINIDESNRASVVHRDPGDANGKQVLEKITLWNVVAGSAQIVTNGVRTIPVYSDEQHPDGALTPGGPGNYSNSKSWYDALNARTAIGLTRGGRTLILFTVDRAGGSLGMSVGEVAELLINDYGVHDALNLDGGGSTSLAMEDPVTHSGKLINVSSDNPNGRAVGSNLAVFAAPVDSGRK
jgi:exopolysaccharide biosynthesis protein